MSSVAIYDKTQEWETTEVAEKVVTFLAGDAAVMLALIGGGTLTAHRFPDLPDGTKQFLRVCVWFPPLEIERNSMNLIQAPMWISYQCSTPDSSDWAPERSMRAAQRAVYASLQNEYITLDRGRMLLPLTRPNPPTSPTYDPDYDVLTSREIWEVTLAPSS